MKKTSLLLVVGIILVLVVATYSGYLYWQRGKVSTDIDTLDRSISSYNEELLKIEHQQVMQAVSAREVAAELRATMIAWSEVVDKIRETVPIVGGLPLVDVLSYSGAVGREISVNARTVPGSEDPYIDVADIIEKFEDSSFFENVFVSSISRGTDEEGDEVLNFPLRFGFVPERNDVEEQVQEPITR